MANNFIYSGFVLRKILSKPSDFNPELNLVLTLMLLRSYKLIFVWGNFSLKNDSSQFRELFYFWFLNISLEFANTNYIFNNCLIYM